MRDIKPGTIEFNAWMDVFNFWKTYGDCKTKEDWQQFHDKAVEIDRKYDKEGHDLVLALLLALTDVAEKQQLKGGLSNG